MEKLQITNYKLQINVAGLLRKRLPYSVYRLIRQIGRIAEQNGFAAYLVGGCLRDLLLGISNLDLDIVVEGSALKFAQCLQAKLKLQVVRHPRFDTASLTLANGFKIDLASARRERYVDVASLPQVYLSFIKEDLLRRDFTINTLAVKINSNDFGRLLDLFSGQRDLQAKKIRVLHQRSFLDDPTRIFRAIRFAQRFNFKIEANTLKLIAQAKKAGAVQALSRFRIGAELVDLLKEERVCRNLARLNQLIGLKIIDPAIKLDRVMMAALKKAQLILHWYKQQGPKQVAQSWLVYFLILTHRLTSAKAAQLCREFALHRQDRAKVKFFQAQARSLIRALSQPTALSVKQVYQMLERLSLEEVLALLSLNKSKRAESRIKLFLNKLSPTRIKLTGRDLIRLKVKPGPMYQRIFQQVLYAKLSGKLKSKAEEIRLVKRILAQANLR